MNEVYQSITNRIIQELDRGVVPWKKGWNAQRDGFARNIVSGEIYRGINFFNLNLVAEYQSSLWMTYKQASDLGGTIKKGEKAHRVLFYKLLPATDSSSKPILDSDGKEKQIPFLRYANVFNLAQTQGVKIPEKFQIQPGQSFLSPIEKGDQLIQNSGVPIKHGFTGACYHPSSDEIHIPCRESFKSPESYYHTTFHELTHASGHPSRLDRPLSGDFGSPAYAKEELIAELGSCFLSATAGIQTDAVIPDSAAYIENWRTTLSKDPKLIVQASSEAQKAADFFIVRSLDQNPSNMLKPDAVHPVERVDLSPKNQRTMSLKL